MKRLIRAWRVPLLVCLLVFSFSAQGQLTANFSATPISGCAPLLVSFTDASTGNPDSWDWDLGNGTHSVFQNPSVTYFTPGTYTVKLVVKKGNQSATEIKTQYITVYAKPTVNFTPSTLTGCFPLPVNFSNTSTPGSGTIASYLWDLGDGNSASTETPSHTYANPGKYDVSLRVINSFGCATTVSKQQLIEVTGGVKAGYTMGTLSSCQTPATVTFTNNSSGTGTLKYSWSFGDGGTSTDVNPTHTFTTPGSYTIRLQVTNGGCTDEYVQHNVSIGNTADFTVPANSCAGETVAFTGASNSTPVSVAWDFGDGTIGSGINFSKQYATPGTYNVKMTANFGLCTDTKTKQVKVLPAMAGDFTVAQSISCKAPFTASFTSNASGAVSYDWDFGDGSSSTNPNPSHIYTGNGSYVVKLTVTNAAGCKKTITKSNFIVVSTPTVILETEPVKACLPYQFRPKLVVNSVSPIVSYQWDFGDGNTGTGIAPVYTYTQEGVYNVSVTYTTSDGCTGTVTKSGLVTAGNKPVVNLSATPLQACARQSISFTDLSTGANIDQWYWEFGDGATSTLQNPVHTYIDTGWFAVSLTAWNYGCRDRFTIPHYLHIDPPIARFEERLSCNNPYFRSFENKSIVNRSRTPLTWFWEFGDGQTATTEFASHTYGAPGTYIVKLTVTNGSCSYTTTRNIFIIDDDNTFTVSENEICPGTTVDYTLTIGNNVNLKDNFWYHDNPVSVDSGLTTLSKTYNAPGLYTTTVYLTDKNKCTKSYPLTVKVIKTAAVLNGPPAICINGVATFNDISETEPGYPIVERIINYGDGSADETNPVNWKHTYNIGNSYTVNFKVKDSKGCSSTTTKTLIVADPVADFISPDSFSCRLKNIAFVAATKPPYSYTWDFGDGNTGTGPGPVHQYAGEGKYTVSLTIEDQYGCKSTKTKTEYIQINDPVALFDVNATLSNCPPLVVTFTNQSQHVESLVWDFGDGNISTLKDPQHFYSYPGEYWPELKVISKGGCIAIYKDKKIEIKGPKGTFTYDNKVGCTPITINFTGQSLDAVSFIWDFNDGATDSHSGSSSTYTYKRPGKYLPRMILTNNEGCAVPILGPDSIEVYDVKADFITDKQVLCDKGIVTFTDQSVSNDIITGYSWQTGDGNSGTGSTFAHEYLTEGDYTVTLEVITQHNCKSIFAPNIPVKVVASPKAGISGPPPACVPAQFTFSGQLLNSNPYPLTWKWDFNNGQTSADKDPAAVTYDKAGDYTVKLTLTNSYNCFNEVTYPVTVHPLPVVDAGTNLVICRDQPKMLQPSGAVNYVWSPNYTLSCTNCETPMVNPANDFTYHVEGESIHGCKASDSVRVTVQQRFTIAAAPGDTLCVGEQFQLRASGADHYSWTPAQSLDNPAIATPVARPQTTVQYQVIGKDNNSCFADTSYVTVIVYPYPHVELGEDKTVAIGTSITLKPDLSEDITRLQWTPANWLSCNNCPEPVVTPKQTIQYKLTASNQGGCTTEDNLTLFVVCRGENMFLPNTFSPNGNGKNEVFYPRGKGLSLIKSFRIFNRWGEPVFEQYNFNVNDRSRGWNGTFKGAMASQDVYVYIIDVVCDNGEILSFKGDVTLLR